VEWEKQWKWQNSGNGRAHRLSTADPFKHLKNISKTCDIIFTHIKSSNYVKNGVYFVLVIGLLRFRHLNTLFTILLILNHCTFEILLQHDNYSSWMITNRNSYHPVLSFNVQLLWDRKVSYSL